MMGIPQVEITFLSAPDSRGQRSPASEEAAEIAIFKSPTIDGGAWVFELAGDRSGFKLFIAGLMHGHALGRLNGKLEMRALGGFEISRDPPPMRGARHG